MGWCVMASFALLLIIVLALGYRVQLCGPTPNSTHPTTLVHRRHCQNNAILPRHTDREGTRK